MLVCLSFDAFMILADKQTLSQLTKDNEVNS